MYRICSQASLCQYKKSSTNHNAGEQPLVLLLILGDHLACIMDGTHLTLAVSNVNYGENDDGK